MADNDDKKNKPPFKAEDYVPHQPPTSEPPEPQGPLQVPLDTGFVLRGREVLKELTAASPDAGADERLLHRLVANEVAIISALLDAQAQLARHVRLLVDEPKALHSVTRVLKDLVHTTNAIGRRVEGALGVAANLRAQRRFFTNHPGKRTGDGF